MPDYSLGKIYKIVNDINEDIYIGSTRNSLAKRFGDHKILAINSIGFLLHMNMKEIGIEHFRIILIEDYPCTNRNELLRREDYHIQQTKPKYNQRINFTNKTEKEYQKEYQKEYRANHKVEKFPKYQKEYRANHKVKKFPKYQFKCDCERILNKNKDTIEQHIKTKIHKAYLESKTLKP
jgi:hypothetical protein